MHGRQSLRYFVVINIVTVRLLAERNDKKSSQISSQDAATRSWSQDSHSISNMAHPTLLTKEYLPGKKYTKGCSIL